MGKYSRVAFDRLRLNGSFCFRLPPFALSLSKGIHEVAT